MILWRHENREGVFQQWHPVSGLCRERLTDKRSEALWKRKAKLRDQIFDIENRLQSDNQLIWMRYGLEEGWKAGREYQKGKR